jgi:hypothetical protein
LQDSGVTKYGYMRNWMLDIPEVLIMLLTALLVVLWTRHWMIHHRAGQTKNPVRDPAKQAAPRSPVTKDA